MRDFQKPGRSAVFAQNGMCATSHPLAAQVAIDILKQGGNAMDAAVAGAVLLGYCEPQMTGLGGDCFALFSPAGSNETLAFNGSGKAPLASDAATLLSQGHSNVPLYDAAAVTVPTAVAAFCTLSERWGKLGIDQLLQPSIHYAESGIPVAPKVAFDWKDGSACLQGAARDYFLVNGKVPKTGDLFYAPKQAEVLKRIAARGRDGFYKGEVAEDMCASLNALGGVHTLEDFETAEGFETTPVGGTYKGAELLEHPPNGQGATAILMLNMLKRFDIAGMDPFGVERTHIEAEIAKLAYDARNRFIADPDHTSATDYLLSEKTADKLAALIDPKRALISPAKISESVHKDTVYITVVDKNRMSVSMIYSIFHSFGSGIASDKFGILFQNRGAGFNLIEGHPNLFAAGKRPMHTIIPGMLAKNGVPVMPFGVMGGQYQPNGHARVLSNMIDFGMDAQSAIDAPRAFSENGVLKIETTYSAHVAASLSEIGHTVERAESPIGGAQAISIHGNGVLEGASDPRKDGCALGY